MKTLRIWLLVLLAVLLPVRGAMAAVMLCPALGEEAPHGMQMHGMQMQETPMQETHDDAAQDAMPPGCDEHATAGHDGASPCQLCCAFCSVTPLPGGLPVLPAAQHFAAAVFPEPLAPAPSFLSSGPERPPKHPTVPRI